MNEQRFKYLWKALCATWRENGHCLKNGCGRGTLEYWVRKTCNVLNPPSLYRAALNEAVKRGWAEKKISKSGYSIFILKC